MDKIVTFASDFPAEAALTFILLALLLACVAKIADIFLSQRVTFKDGFFFDEADVAMSQRVRRALDR